MINLIQKHRFVAILRNIELSFTENVAKSLYNGGVRVFEVTFDPSDNETIKNTKAKGNKNKFSFYANTAVQVSAPDSLLPIAISNPTVSEEILVCSLVNSDGVVVYRSLGIVPGKYLNNIRLSQYLDYGNNELMLYVSAFRAETKDGKVEFEKVGTQRAEIEVLVGSDYMSE
jgi:hypothetical protein